MPGDRIEHASVTPPEVIAVMAHLSLTVVTQPAFVAARGDVYLRDVDPADRPDLYRCASLLEAGVAVGGSTDAPFGPDDPWLAMRAATRAPRPERLSGRGGPGAGVRRCAGPLPGAAGAAGRARPSCPARGAGRSLPARRATRRRAPRALEPTCGADHRRGRAYVRRLSADRGCGLPACSTVASNKVHTSKRSWRATGWPGPEPQPRGDAEMASEGLHEAADLLDEATVDHHRAMTSLCEELEAIDWYDQRVKATVGRQPGRRPGPQPGRREGTRRHGARMAAPA